MNDLETLVFPTIQALLQARGTEVGARLKQLLNQEFTRRGLPPFDQRRFGFPNFVKVLESRPDLFLIQRPNGAGDFTVCAVTPPQGVRPPPTPRGRSRFRFRRDVWKAFVATDDHQTTFINRATGAITSADSRNDDKASADQLVTIVPISAATQREWMRKYVNELPLAPEVRVVLAQIADHQPLTRKVSQAFTDALGDHATGWKARRWHQISSAIDEWARKNGIQRRVLTESAENTATLNDHMIGSSQTTQPHTRALALLELFSNEEVDELIIPVLLAAQWMRSRSRKQ